jgi:hypothetical protein
MLLPLSMRAAFKPVDKTKVVAASAIDLNPMFPILYFIYLFIRHCDESQF